MGISEVVWIAFMLGPAAMRIQAGGATGIAITVPRALRWLPRPVQIPATMLAVPLVIGSLGAYVRSQQLDPARTSQTYR